MLEELIGKLNSEVGGQINSQTQLPTGNMDGIFSVIGNVVKNEAGKQMVSGNLSNLTNLFSDKPNNDVANQIQSKMHSDVISELTSKMGISMEQSKGVAEIALPALIEMIAKQSANSKGNSSSLSEIFGATNSGGLMGIVIGFLGRFLKK